MRFLIGCSAAVAVVAFIIGFTVSLFVAEATWTDRLTMAAMPSAMAFVAALLLFSRDSHQHSATMRTVRTQLLTRNDLSDEEFLSSLSCGDASLLLETRNAISRFFDVPSVKVHRDLHLICDLHVDKLEPSFQFCVVESVIASQPHKPKPFGFAMAGLGSIDDLAQAIQKVLDGFDRNDRTETENESSSSSESQTAK